MPRGKSAPIALAIAHDKPAVDCAMAASVAGCLFSAAHQVELAYLMRSIERGDAPMATRIARRIVRSNPINVKNTIPPLAAEAANDAELSPARPTGRKNLLSPRELEVLRLIAQGWSSRQIAEAIPRSIHTIETQVKSIYRKLAVKSRTQAVREATQKGLLVWDKGETPPP